MTQNLNLIEAKETTNLSLKRHLDLIEQEIINKNNQFRKLRQNLFNLNSDMERMEKGDQLTKMLNDNQLQHDITKLQTNLDDNQNDILNQMKVQQQQLNELSGDNLQLNEFLSSLEQRLKNCQNKIGIFN